MLGEVLVGMILIVILLVGMAFSEAVSELKREHNYFRKKR